MFLMNASFIINFTVFKIKTRFVIFLVFDQGWNFEFYLYFTYWVYFYEIQTHTLSFYLDFTSV
jgi:hypothetical protein